MLKRISKIIEKTSLIVFVLTILICLCFSVFIVPRIFGVTPFVVMSGSMEPTIPAGSVVFVNTKDTEVEVGDVVTYTIAVGEGKGAFVTHRVNAIDDSGLIQTKGDNNENPDGYLDPEAIKGTVWFHIPYAGYVLEQLQEFGFVLLAIWVLEINVVLYIVSRALDSFIKESATE